MEAELERALLRVMLPRAEALAVLEAEALRLPRAEALLVVD